MENLVELHIHLEGALRHETIHQLLKQKSLPIPGDGTLQGLKNYMIVKEPKGLAQFLKPFVTIVSVIKDCKVAERIAYEFIEDMHRNNVKYVEARYSPHNFITDQQRNQCKMAALEQVIKAITRGFERGEKDFGVKARSILCALNGTHDVLDILELSRKFKNEGVVGIDMATKQGTDIFEEIILDEEAIYTFEEARKSGVHRTIHAGETGGPDMILRALNVFHTERIGHGYHVLDDDKVYKRCIAEKIHFECCPYSSRLTGAVPLSVKVHPIVKFSQDCVNYSINSDDPTVTGHWVQDDYELVKSWDVPEKCLKRANLNAAKSCFLPEKEKNDLIRLICGEE